MADQRQFSFNISLSVLNHLGRNLYRNFITVLGEAISNSWDADAKNVWIYIDRKEKSFVIKDDGIGMLSDDFQHKFLKIGYSKRKDGSTTSKEGRPFIGRKGIGKLALLSCAEKISVISKKKNAEYVGGVIVNSGLDEAITDDLAVQDYKLNAPEMAIFGERLKNHTKGTVIHFGGVKGGITNTVSYLRTLIALYFRFALVDEKFHIYLNDEEITLNDLKSLSDKTEFLWRINNIDDPYVNTHLTALKESKTISLQGFSINGFIASVEKPSNIKIRGSDEKASIDLFVNGRLREKDILRHIQSARIVESYLYGQIHLNELDGEKDIFTSSREGVVEDDPLFQKLLKTLKDGVMRTVLEDWDVWRLKHKQDGDSENPRKTKKERTSKSLYNAVTDDYIPSKGSGNKKKIDGWISSLSDDAEFNFSSYAECFISENLIRKYSEDKSIVLNDAAEKKVKGYKINETNSKNAGNVSIDIRKGNSDLSYLSMDDLANWIDKIPSGGACLAKDAKEYKPMRDAVAHTALLSSPAKSKLTSVYENIKARINTLLK